MLHWPESLGSHPSVADVMERIHNNDVVFIDFRFIDLPGLQQSFSVPAHRVNEDTFIDGLAFDGSSVRGYTAIQESDMQLVPDPSSAFVDPFRAHPTIAMNCFVRDPLTGEPFSRDPRGVAQRAEAYLHSTGIADTIFMGPEAEFFIFDKVGFQNEAGHSFFKIESKEAAWSTGDMELGGYPLRHKGGYFPTSPADRLIDVRAEMVLALEEAGIETELHHHECATAGQCEIGVKFDTLARSADKLMMFKYFVRNVANEFGMTATFMPKPVFGDNGSGMHTHQSLFKDGEPLFYDENGYAGLSDLARWYIGGLLAHAPAVMAFTNATTNSYKRLVPGYEAPVNMVYSQRNRSAAVRIPLTGANPKAKRVEFRVPDPLANPYLAFSAMLMAGLDGIARRIEPHEPVDKDIYELGPEALADLPAVPASLEEALAALVDDHDFLLAGGVFTPDLIETHVNYKMEHEVTQLRLRPTPFEFEMYYVL